MWAGLLESIWSDRSQGCIPRNDMIFLTASGSKGDRMDGIGKERKRGRGDEIRGDYNLQISNVNTYMYMFLHVFLHLDM